MNNNYNNKLITNKGWLVNPHLFRVNSRNHYENSVPKYGTTFVISKDDKETLEKIDIAIKAAIKKGNFPDNAEIKLPLKDGDIIYSGEALYENSMYLYASTTFKPYVVNHKLTEITYKMDEYQSGTYAKLSLEFVPYHFRDINGISVRLLNVQVFPQNRLLELRSKPEDDFVVEDVDEE